MIDLYVQAEACRAKVEALGAAHADAREALYYERKKWTRFEQHVEMEEDILHEYYQRDWVTVDPHEGIPDLNDLTQAEVEYEQTGIAYRKEKAKLQKLTERIRKMEKSCTKKAHKHKAKARRKHAKKRQP